MFKMNLTNVKNATKEDIAMLHDNFTRSMDTFNSKLSALTSGGNESPTLESLRLEFQTFQTDILGMLQLLNSMFTAVSVRLDDLENYSRRNCPVIHGVPETDAENPERSEQVVENIFNELEINNFKFDIITMLDRCHRLGPPAINSRPRPIIVKLTSYNIKHKILVNKKQLKGKSYSISESLTKMGMELYKKAKDALGIRNIWTRDGRIMTSLPNGKITKISTELELQSTVAQLPLKTGTRSASTTTAPKFVKSTAKKLK